MGVYQKGHISANPEGHNQYDIIRTLKRVAHEPAGRLKRARIEIVCRNIVSEAQKGSLGHQTLLLNYLIGKPKETIDHNIGPSQLMMDLVRMIGQGRLDDRAEDIDALTIEHAVSE